MVIAADYPLLEVFWTILIFMAWVAWLMILINVFGDIFRRADLSGWGKACWTLFTLVVPFLGVLVYLIVQGKEMGERRAGDIKARQAEFDAHVKSVAGGGPASEIASAKQLLDTGVIDNAEFERLKQRALAAS